MSIKGHFLFLGSGGSMGVPVIGCHCQVCLSTSPCNKRLRPSGLIMVKNKKYLIDCGPDFRNQALLYHIENLDGLILTHAHHDHTAGIDELRVYYMRHKTSIACLASRETISDVKRRFPYIFESHSDKLTAKIVMQELEGECGQTLFQGLDLSYFSYEQAKMKVNGFCLGNFAYVSDIKNYQESIFESLKGIDVLVLSALSRRSSPFHLNVDEAIAFSDKVGAKETWLMHIAHDLDHEETNAYLPPHVRMAYDGLEINFDLQKIEKK